MEGVCPRCGEEAVNFDVVAGVSACEVCGMVLAEETLVHHSTFDDQGPTGVWVGETDTGERAGALSMQGDGAAPLAVQRSGRRDGEAKLKQRVREFGALLRLQPSVLDQALHVMGQAVPHFLGNWRRDHLAAAIIYAACRLNTLPLTLADLSVATQIDARTLGRYYRGLARTLNLQPPLLGPLDLLPRSIDRVTAEAVQAGGLAAGTAATLQRDAAMALDWMQRQLQGRSHPMANVGAAIWLAAEMNRVSLSPDHICSSLQLVRNTLDRKLGQARQRLLQLASLLPYAGNIHSKNVGSHARTIMKLSSLMGSAGGSGGGASIDGSSMAQAGVHAAAAAAVPPPPPPAVGSQQAAAAVQQAQPAGSGQAAARATRDQQGAAAPPAAEHQGEGEQLADDDDGGDGQAQHKRARLHGPDETADAQAAAATAAAATGSGVAEAADRRQLAAGKGGGNRRKAARSRKGQRKAG